MAVSFPNLAKRTVCSFATRLCERLVNKLLRSDAGQIHVHVGWYWLVVPMWICRLREAMSYSIMLYKMLQLHNIFHRQCIPEFILFLCWADFTCTDSSMHRFQHPGLDPGLEAYTKTS